MATDRPDDKVLLSVTADGGDGWAKGPEAADGHTGRDDEARPTVEEGAPPSPDGAPDAAVSGSSSGVAIARHKVFVAAGHHVIAYAPGSAAAIPQGGTGSFQ